MSYCYEYPRPAVTADIAVFRSFDNQTQLLLVRRKHPPFEGMWALPGGFMNMDESLEETASRELQEETGLTGIALEQMHTYSALHRDPRHRTLTTVFAGRLQNQDMLAKAGDDAAETGWFEINNLPLLAFDHDEIIRDVIREFL